MSQNIIAICTLTRNIWVLISPCAYQQWILSIFNFFFQSTRQKIESHCPFRRHFSDCCWDWVHWNFWAGGLNSKIPILEAHWGYDMENRLEWKWGSGTRENGQETISLLLPLPVALIITSTPRCHPLTLDLCPGLQHHISFPVLDITLWVSVVEAAQTPNVQSKFLYSVPSFYQTNPLFYFILF